MLIIKRITSAFLTFAMLLTLSPTVLTSEDEAYKEPSLSEDEYEYSDESFEYEDTDLRTEEPADEEPEAEAPAESENEAAFLTKSPRLQTMNTMMNAIPSLRCP